jgi:hypothetical protein
VFAIVGLFVARPTAAQTTVNAIGSAELRYHGDTIWRTRDTTMTRLILRGDTAVRTMYVNGKLVSSLTYVQRGDEAQLVASSGADGLPRGSIESGNRVPMMVVLGERQMLEQALRTEQMQARLPAMARPGMSPDASPASPREYFISANTRIVQHRDTVRYVRGCSAVPPIDTTLYVLFGSDSVQRRSPVPRTFDRHMVSAIRADMSTAMTREQLAARSEQGGVRVPSLSKWPCDGR